MKQLLITIAAVVLVGCGELTIQEAARRANIEAVKQHIAAGTDVNAKQKAGITPLDWADGETADLLRKHGAKTAKELKAEGK